MEDILEIVEVTDFTLFIKKQFNGDNGTEISCGWILLDNQSTVKIFTNKKIITDINMTGKCTELH